MNYVLKGINGWSDLNLQTINVLKIISCNYRKRWFCIFDRDYKYVLEIGYNSPISYTVFLGYPHRYVDHIPIITKRYKSVEDINDEIQQINVMRHEIMNSLK